MHPSFPHPITTWRAAADVIVSATNDKHAADATEIVDTARLAASNGDDDARPHLRYASGHSLDQERFDAIINWVVQP